MVEQFAGDDEFDRGFTHSVYVPFCVVHLAQIRITLFSSFKYEPYLHKKV